MGLVNAIIAGEKELSSRMRLRTNFSNVGVTTFIKKFKGQLSDVPAIMVQFNAFDEMQGRDEVSNTLFKI